MINTKHASVTQSLFKDSTQHTLRNMMKKLILIVCISAFFIHRANSHGCEETSSVYLYSSITVTCANNTRSIPAFNKTVNVLKCLDCNIPIVDNTAILINFRGDIFNLSNSHVRKIKMGAFKNFLNNTNQFVFENNEIDYIEPKVFSNFNAIDQIKLRNSKISSLQPGVFDDTSLSVLDLSLNHLSNISFIFDGIKVTKLNLSTNAIKELAEDTFDKVTFWSGRKWRIGTQELDLSKNFLEKIIPNTFKSPNKDNTIRNLYLGTNSINAIENNTFSQLSDLRILSLEENKISSIYKDSFKGLTSMTSLILKKNLITNIPIGLFGDLGRLEMLDLSDNRLSSLSPNTFSGLISLTKLNISHNELKVFEDSHLFPLGKLISLDVSDTKLHDLKLEIIMEHHFRLRVLVLNDNFWTCKHLVQMYKLMNHRGGGFDYPARHFDVPNLHGIACSRVELESYENLSFEEFLNIISQDHVFEDIFDSRINQDQENPYSDIQSVIKNINNITCMFIILTIIGIILFISCVFKFVVLYLRSQNIIKNNKFTFAYAQNQDNVELLH
ncbi:hypothetical protein RN001_001012 [Aquatica leii]|uniref:Uncharacterized protein n=1 Tax=Aquatica leii TaxID=1421715 RepID=A0AAN7PKS5_9COLE|nr:hypothetical protein RN001_001012 [Aquatica leii]